MHSSGSAQFVINWQALWCQKIILRRDVATLFWNEFFTIIYREAEENWAWSKIISVLTARQWSYINRQEWQWTNCHYHRTRKYISTPFSSIPGLCLYHNTHVTVFSHLGNEVTSTAKSGSEPTVTITGLGNISLPPSAAAQVCVYIIIPM